MDGDDVPVDVRSLTSPRVVAVERHLRRRFAGRGEGAGRSLDRARIRAWLAGLGPDQALAVAALAGSQGLAVVEGAAGAGKTAALAAAQSLQERQRRRMLVVSPTLKGAKVASAHVGAPGYSVAWLLRQYGFRWDDHGHWQHAETAPRLEARLRPGDLLVVDEAGMLDQDSAAALVRIADATGARLALVGDRHQLPAVGRGGVLDLACRYAVDSHVDLDGVRRFADPDYATLSLWMRTGKHPEVVFDRLLARGEIVVHASEVEQIAVLARIAAETEAAVVADTREQVGRINGLARQCHSVGFETKAGERISVGDRVATRRNNPDADVANRETWMVLDVNKKGVELEGQAGHRRLPRDYAREHVELAYATTTYGVQGETVSVAHVAIGTHTSAKSTYVGMTRGRDHNIAHLVADSIDDARSQWVQVFSRDRADLGPANAARRAAEDIERYGPRQVFRPRPPSRAGMDNLTRRQGAATQSRGIGL